MATVALLAVPFVIEALRADRQAAAESRIEGRSQVTFNEAERYDVNATLNTLTQGIENEGPIPTSAAAGVDIGFIPDIIPDDRFGEGRPTGVATHENAGVLPIQAGPDAYETKNGTHPTVSRAHLKELVNAVDESFNDMANAALAQRIQLSMDKQTPLPENEQTVQTSNNEEKEKKELEMLHGPSLGDVAGGTATAVTTVASAGYLIYKHGGDALWVRDHMRAGQRIYTAAETFVGATQDLRAVAGENWQALLDAEGAGARTVAAVNLGLESAGDAFGVAVRTFESLEATPDQILNYQANLNLLSNPTGLDFIDENIPERIRQARLPSLDELGGGARRFISGATGVDIGDAPPMQQALGKLGEWTGAPEFDFAERGGVNVITGRSLMYDYLTGEKLLRPEAAARIKSLGPALMDIYHPDTDLGYKYIRNIIDPEGRILPEQPLGTVLWKARGLNTAVNYIAEPAYQATTRKIGEGMDALEENLELGDGFGGRVVNGTKNFIKSLIDPTFELKRQRGMLPEQQPDHPLNQPDGHPWGHEDAGGPSVEPGPSTDEFFDAVSDADDEFVDAASDADGEFFDAASDAEDDFQDAVEDSMEPVNAEDTGRYNPADEFPGVAADVPDLDPAVHANNPGLGDAPVNPELVSSRIFPEPAITAPKYSLPAGARTTGLAGKINRGYFQQIPLALDEAGNVGKGVRGAAKLGSKAAEIMFPVLYATDVVTTETAYSNNELTNRERAVQESGNAGSLVGGVLGSAIGGKVFAYAGELAVPGFGFVAGYVFGGAVGGYAGATGGRATGGLIAGGIYDANDSGNGNEHDRRVAQERLHNLRVADINIKHANAVQAAGGQAAYDAWQADYERRHPEQFLYDPETLMPLNPIN